MTTYNRWLARQERIWCWKAFLMAALLWGLFAGFAYLLDHF